jgi:DNA-binding transcriptional LysR family regulator
MLNVQRLTILREVAERGSVAAAAHALFLTPSAVSQQMRSFERETGVPLLERHGRGIRLTEAGDRLLARAPAVFEALEQAEAELAAVSTGTAGFLRVAAYPTAARALLVPALASLRRDQPRLRIGMVDLEPEQSMPSLRVGELDVVVANEYTVLPEPANPNVERVPLLVEPVLLALPRSHPRAGLPTGMADLSLDQFIVGRDATPFLDLVVRLAEAEGYDAHVDMHSNDFQVILAAVGAGLGVALVPSLALLTDYPDVVFQPVEGLDLERRTWAAIRRGAGANPAIAAVIGALQAAAVSVAATTPGTSV